MLMIATTAAARWRRLAYLLAVTAGSLAALLPATSPAEAGTCTLSFYWNNDGSPTWRSEAVDTDSCGVVPTITRSGNGTQFTTPGSFYLFDWWWNIDGSPNWANYGPSTYPVMLASSAMAASGTEVAYEGTDGSLWFAWNTDPTGNPSGWTLEKVAPAGSVVGKPAITPSTHGVGITARAPNGSLWFYWALNGTSTWHPVQIGAAGSTEGNPVIANASGATVITAIAPNGSVWFYWNIDGNPTWNPEQIAGPGAAAAFVSSSAAVELTSSATEIAYTAPNGSVWLAQAPNGTVNWQFAQVAGQGTVSASTSPAITRSASATELASTAPDGSVWFYWNNDGSGTWYCEQVTSPGGFSGATPAIVRSGSATEIVIVQ